MLRRLLLALATLTLAVAPAAQAQEVATIPLKGAGKASPGSGGIQGLVSTRQQIPSANNANTFVNSDYGFQAAVDIPGPVKVIVGSFRVAGTTAAETGNAATTTVSCSIQYPAGTKIGDCLFSGSTTGTIPAKGILVSDSFTLSATIPQGQKGIFRVYMNNASGFQDEGTAGKVSNATWGDKECVASGSPNNLGNSSLALTTGNMGGTSPTCVTNRVVPMIALIGTTTGKSISIEGDSIGWGYLDTDTNTQRHGIVARAISTSDAMLNLSSGGGQVQCWRQVAGCTAAYATNRLAIIAMNIFNIRIVQLGTNDLFVGGAGTPCGGVCTAAAVKSNLEWLYTQSTGARILQTTITHNTTSSDSWATAGINQTVNGNTAQLTSLNSTIRSLGLTGQTDYLETTNPIENNSATHDGKWLVNGAANYCTTDGTHPTPTCYGLAAAAIDTAKIVTAANDNGPVYFAANDDWQGSVRMRAVRSAVGGQ